MDNCTIIPGTIIPGLDCSLNGAQALFAEALTQREKFDAVVYSGRSGGFLAACHQLHQQMSTIPAAVVASKWHSMGHSGKRLGRLKAHELIREGQPLVDLLKSMIPEDLHRAYTQWLWRKPQAKLPMKRPRLLLLDDTVTVIHGSTYEFIRRLCWACGAKLIGYVTGTEGLDNGFNGFHSNAEWQRWHHFYTMEDFNELRRVLPRLKRAGKLDEQLADLL